MKSVSYTHLRAHETPANHENLSVDDLSNNIEMSLMEWGETYQAVVNLPLDQQDPKLLIISDPINTQQTSNKFKISDETFDITGPGKLRYEVTQQDGTDLPRWLAFLTSDLSIVGLGKRLSRFAMIVDDGKIVKIFNENGPGLDLSKAENVIKSI